MLGDRGVVNQVITGPLGAAHPLPLLYNQAGVLIGMTHVMLPFMTLILLGSMMRVNPRLVPAARTLGARPLVAFRAVFLPLTAPGVLAGTMMIAVYSLGFFVVPAVLGGAAQTTVVMAIRDLALTLGIWGLASAMAVVVVVVSLAGAWVYVRVTGLADTAERQ
jgi:ABC-type spermidine/putrescine transport system permease subunit I